MKILLIHNYYRYKGGEETYLHSLFDLLIQHGHEVYLYTKDSNNIGKKMNAKLSITGNLFWNNNVYEELKKIIKDFQPDIAHFNNIFPLITPTAYQVCKDLKIPIVQTIHNYRLLCPKGTLYKSNSICELCVKKTFKYPSILYKCYQNSHLASAVLSSSLFFHSLSKSFEHIDQFIFPSKFSLQYHEKYINNLKDKSTYIPYFVPAPEIKKQKSSYFLYIGRFSEEKGIEELLEIFSKLPNIFLKAIGDGPLKKNLEYVYAKYPNISFNSFSSSKVITKYIQNAKCVIISSKWYEVLPFVYLEALSNNTPVLTPNTDVFNRSIETNELFFYRFNDFIDLKEKIININNTPTITHKFYEEYKKYYTPQIHYKKLLNIYNKII